MAKNIIGTGSNFVTFTYDGSDYQIDLMVVFLFLVIALLVWALGKAQAEDDKFDMRDLIVDKKSGRISVSRFSQVVALCVSTWSFVYQTLNHSLTEWYFTAYMAVWVSAEAIRKWRDLKVYEIDRGQANKDNEG